MAVKNKAQTLFDYTLLKSPINGIVGHIDITKGNYVSPSSEALFSIIQKNPVRVEFAISDKEYLAQLKKHPDGTLFNSEKIQIRLADNSIYEHSGIFKFNNNTLNKETNSISVYADFENSEKKLMPNSYVDILISKNLKNVFLIRQNYVTLSNDGAFVSVMKNGKILRTPLHIVGYYGDYFVADNAFEKNEFLVIDKPENIPPETILTMKITDPEDK
ncbi:MAG: efflux RND transporter periplasmic adaptor subunit [Alphaproteobacteria bacterium]|nr:efflux RND transporter periplasmic adaptor subunit [Alphaproteobacteria bacterium]